MLGLITTTAWMPGAVEAPLVLRWAAIAVGAPLCLLLCSRDVRLPLAPLGLLAIAAWSLMWTPVPIDGLHDLFCMIALLAAFVLGVSVLNVRSLWMGIAAGVSISAAIALAQVFGWDGLVQTAAPAGLFGNRDFLGEASMVGVIVSLMSGAGLWVLLSLLGLILAGSKAAFAGVAVALAAYLMPRHRKIAIGILSLVAITAMWFFLGGHPSAIARFEIWGHVTNVPEFGNGLGSFYSNFPEHEYVHSEPLQLFYEFGLLSIPFFAYAAYVAAGWSRETQTEFMVLAAIAVVALLSFPFHMPVTGLAAAVAAGRLVALRSRLVELHDSRSVAIGASA